MNLNEKLQLAYRKLADSKRVLLIAHTSPDSDAMSSLGAFLEITRGLKIEAYTYAGKKSEGAFNFIPNDELVSSIPPDDLKDFDSIFILDCGSISRTGLEDRLTSLLMLKESGVISERPYIVEIDHHEPQDEYADLEIRLPSKASTTEIIYLLLKENNIEITKTLATCILIGLITDTGHFLHANSSKEALAVSSEMLLCGASLPKIINQTFNNKSFAALKIWGRALENIKYNSDTGFASSALSRSEIDNLLSPAERELSVELFGDIVSFMSYLSGVHVALLLREEEGRVKGSLRTNYDDVDVAKIAKQFGGGGHKRAAGFSVDGKLKETENGWKIIK